jgi:hypothetical protein
VVVGEGVLNGGGSEEGVGAGREIEPGGGASPIEGPEDGIGADPKSAQDPPELATVVFVGTAAGAPKSKSSKIPPFAFPLPFVVPFTGSAVSKPPNSSSSAEPPAFIFPKDDGRSSIRSTSGPADDADGVGGVGLLTERGGGRAGESCRPESGDLLKTRRQKPLKSQTRQPLFTSSKPDHRYHSDSPPYPPHHNSCPASGSRSPHSSSYRSQSPDTARHWSFRIRLRPFASRRQRHRCISRGSGGLFCARL